MLIAVAFKCGKGLLTVSLGAVLLLLLGQGEFLRTAGKDVWEGEMLRESEVISHLVESATKCWNIHRQEQGLVSSLCNFPLDRRFYNFTRLQAYSQRASKAGG